LSEETGERRPSEGEQTERAEVGGADPGAEVVRGRPDVFLDIPELEIEELDLEVENLRAQIAVNAELPNMVRLNVGVEAVLGSVKLGIKGLEGQVQLTVHLDNIRSILEGVLEAADRNPKILEGLTRAAEATAEGTATEAADEPEPPPPPRQGGQVTDGAKRRARELGVDLSGVRGTGQGGRVTARDVDKAARGASS